MKNNSIGKITGYSLILMAIISGYVFGYAYPHFTIIREQNILSEDIELYKQMLQGILLIIILDIIVSYTLYLYFKESNKRISSIAFILRILYTIILVIATYYLLENITSERVTHELIKYNLEKFEKIWNLGLILFGFHLLIISMLMDIYKKIPKNTYYIDVNWCNFLYSY